MPAINHVCIAHPEEERIHPRAGKNCIDAIPAIKAAITPTATEKYVTTTTPIDRSIVTPPAIKQIRARSSTYQAIVAGSSKHHVSTTSTKERTFRSYATVYSIRATSPYNPIVRSTTCKERVIPRSTID